MFDKVLNGKFSRRSFLAGLGAAAALPVLAACEPQIIEVEKIQIVEKEVPIERVVTQVIDRPVEKIITVEVEKAVEVEKVITVEVEKPVMMERIVTVEVERAVEVIREVEKVVTVEVEKETIREIEIEVEKETIVEVPAERGELGELSMRYWFHERIGWYAPIISAETGIVMRADSYAGDFWGKLTAELAAGTAPDVLYLNNANWGDFFALGVVRPYDDYFKSYGLNKNDWAADPWLECGFRGKLLGLSVHNQAALGIWFDGDALDKYGIGEDLPVWGSSNFDSWVMDDMVEWARNATIKDGDETEVYGWESGLEWFFWDPAKNAVLSNGGAWSEDMWGYDPDKCLLNSPEVVEALQPFADLMHEGVMVDRPTYAAGASAGGDWAYLSKKSFNWNFQLTSRAFIEAYKDKNQEYIMYPPWQANMKPQLIGWEMMAVNGGGPQQDLAAEWIKEFTTNPRVCQEKANTWRLPTFQTRRWVEAQEEGEIKMLNLMSLVRLPAVSAKPEYAEDTVVWPGHMGLKGWKVREVESRIFGEDVWVKDGTKTVQQGMNELVDEVNAEWGKGYDVKEYKG